jgi:hypothetical protein
MQSLRRRVHVNGRQLFLGNHRSNVRVNNHPKGDGRLHELLIQVRQSCGRKRRLTERRGNEANCRRRNIDGDYASDINGGVRLSILSNRRRDAASDHRNLLRSVLV